MWGPKPASGGGPSMGDIAQVYERNQDATLGAMCDKDVLDENVFEELCDLHRYVGNLEAAADEDLLLELFTQFGPVKIVNVPKDKVTGNHQGYAFVEFETEADADYALKIANLLKVFGRPLRLNKAAQDRRTFDVGANLFVGNLDPDVEEQLLFDTFSSFGNVVSAKVMRDGETGASKGFGFVSFSSFEASDAALAAMNGQFVCNRPIHVSYAYKKDTRGERHGSAAERLLAANRPSLDGRNPAGDKPLAGPLPLQQQRIPGADGFGIPPMGIGGAGSFPTPPFPGMPPLPLPFANSKQMVGSGLPHGLPLPPPPLFFMPRPGMAFPPLPVPPGVVASAPNQTPSVGAPSSSSSSVANSNPPPPPS